MSDFDYLAANVQAVRRAAYETEIASLRTRLDAEHAARLEAEKRLAEAVGVLREAKDLVDSARVLAVASGRAASEAAFIAWLKSPRLAALLERKGEGP